MTNSKNPAEMSDLELEKHIKDCGHLMEQEMANGNREAALGWLQMMQQAIRAHSPEQVAAMERRLGLNPCYFNSKGAEDRLWLLERQAA